MSKKRSAAGWHPEDIKAAVRKAGWTLESLARANGVSRDACRHALRHPRFHGEVLIADLIGVPAHQIWPDRFNADGSRRPQRRNRRNDSLATRVATTQIGSPE